jgi:hypothetical protein
MGEGDICNKKSDEMMQTKKGKEEDEDWTEEG